MTTAMTTALRFASWGFPDPRDVGQSEYLAIHDCISDGLEGCEPGEERDLADAMLEEFESWARSLREKLHKRVGKSGKARVEKRAIVAPERP